MRYESIESGLFRPASGAGSLEKLAAPLARLLAHLHVTPNQVSTAGFALNVGAAFCIASGDLVVAGIVYIVAGCLDLMDGTLARVTGRATKFGAFFDSTVDRISEGVVFAAITYRFAIDGESVLAAVVVLALRDRCWSVMSVPAPRAWVASARSALLTRAERVILLTLGLLFGLLAQTIVLLAV